MWVGISDVKEDSEVQGRDPDMHGVVLLCTGCMCNKQTVVFCFNWTS